MVDERHHVMAKSPEWMIGLAKALAELHEGLDAGWGIYDMLLRQYVPVDIRRESRRKEIHEQS